MSKGLEALNEMRKYGAVMTPNCEIIEKELKEYQEIEEIAKQYNWDDITHEIFNVKTDKKYRDLFDSAIVNIQEDYRKARALEIIIEHKVFVAFLLNSKDLIDYNSHVHWENSELTQEEYDLIKGWLNE